eukprot:scaffold16878_cov64-Cylindrotheca_fusiformis.AAC.2
MLYEKRSATYLNVVPTKIDKGGGSKVTSSQGFQEYSRTQPEPRRDGAYPSFPSAQGIVSQQ